MMSDGDSQLIIDVRPGEFLIIGGQRIVVELLEKSGKLARLRVTAPPEVKIERGKSTCLAPCVAG